MNKKIKLSKRSNRLIGQGMFQIKAKAKKKGLLHFEIGDSCFKPNRKITKALIRALANKKTHYTDPLGLPELRKAIADKYDIEVKHVAICPANFGIFAAMSILCDKDVYYEEPSFPTYKAVAKYLGLKRNPSSKVRIICSPNNPTGKMESYDGEDKFIIYDGAYIDMTYEDKTTLQLGLENSLGIFSFSKSHAMSGYRLGYIIAKPEIIEKIGLLIETTYSCLPAFIQYAGIEALKIDRYKMKALKHRRDLMYDILKHHYELEKPKGSIYCWCKCEDGDKEFERLLKKGIVVCPGSVFGKKNYIRFCFAKSLFEILELRRKLCE